jgi:hypothetical protein
LRSCSKTKKNVDEYPRVLDYLEAILCADGANVKIRQLLNNKLAVEDRALN